MEKNFNKKGICGIVLFLVLMTSTVFASEMDSSVEPLSYIHHLTFSGIIGI